MSNYGDGSHWRAAATRSLDAMYERATKAEAERDEFGSILREARAALAALDADLPTVRNIDAALERVYAAS